MRQYWIRNESRESGPFTREQLEVRIAMGHVRTFSEVRETDGDRSTKWLRVADVPVLRELVERYTLPEECLPGRDDDGTSPPNDSANMNATGSVATGQSESEPMHPLGVFALLFIGGFLVWLVVMAFSGGAGSTASNASQTSTPPLRLPQPASSLAPTSDDPDEWQRFYQTPEGKRQMQRDLESLERQLNDPKTAAEVERILRGGK